MTRHDPPWEQWDHQPHHFPLSGHHDSFYDQGPDNGFDDAHDLDLLVAEAQDLRRRQRVSARASQGGFIQVPRIRHRARRIVLFSVVVVTTLTMAALAGLQLSQR